MKRILRIFLVTFISNSLVLLPFSHVFAAEDLALPSGDVVAPVIKHTPNKTVAATGGFIEIHATVTDNVGVKDVIVFYRNKVEDKEFKRLHMTREYGADFYTASLPAAIAPNIEYYIQATDLAGNTILHGHTFSPLSIAVSPGALVPDESPKKITMIEDEPVAKPSEGVNKWVWIGLGVVLVGALAGGDDGGPGPPTTGTVTITGPTP